MAIRKPRLITRATGNNPAALGSASTGTSEAGARADHVHPVRFAPGSSNAPVNNGDVTFELTSNTTLTIKAKGSDGTIRSVALTLA